MTRRQNNSTVSSQGSISRIPRAESPGECEFALHCRIYKLTPEREYQFDSSRKWRIDFAWPDRKLAVEIESSVHRIKGRFASDIPTTFLSSMVNTYRSLHEQSPVHLMNRFLFT
jgi:hypothetical protein